MFTIIPESSSSDTLSSPGAVVANAGTAEGTEISGKMETDQI